MDTNGFQGRGCDTYIDSEAAVSSMARAANGSGPSEASKNRRVSGCTDGGQGSGEGVRANGARANNKWLE